MIFYQRISPYSTQFVVVYLYLEPGINGKDLLYVFSLEGAQELLNVLSCFMALLLFYLNCFNNIALESNLNLSCKVFISKSTEILHLTY